MLGGRLARTLGRIRAGIGARKLSETSIRLDRRAAILSDFSDAFGPRALQAADFVDYVWQDEESRPGATAALSCPGYWIGVGREMPARGRPIGLGWDGEPGTMDEHHRMARSRPGFELQIRRWRPSASRDGATKLTVRPQSASLLLRRSMGVGGIPGHPDAISGCVSPAADGGGRRTVMTVPESSSISMRNAGP